MESHCEDKGTSGVIAQSKQLNETSLCNVHQGGSQRANIKKSRFARAWGSLAAATIPRQEFARIVAKQLQALPGGRRCPKPRRHHRWPPGQCH